MKAMGQQVEAGDLRVRLEVLAWTAARQGHDDLAAHLFGAVAAAWDALGAAHPLIDPRQYDQARAMVRRGDMGRTAYVAPARQYDQARAMVRRRLGEAPYGAAWDEGYRRWRGSAPGRRANGVEPAVVP